jgi:hypothetical protein
MSARKKAESRRNFVTHLDKLYITVTDRRIYLIFS